MRFRETTESCKINGWCDKLATAWLICALVILQAVPVTARSSEDGAWFEICSEAGIVLKKIDMSDAPDTENTPCPKCSQCPFCAIAGLDVILASTFAGKTEFFVAPKSFRASQTNVANAAQFWPDNRGPPLAEGYIQHHLRDAAKGFTIQFGDAPWS